MKTRCRLPESRSYDYQYTQSPFSNKKDGALNNNGNFEINHSSNPRSIKMDQILPHVSRRPYLSVSPDALFIQIGTFLATGSRIYVDGLIVERDNKLEGKIGGHHVLKQVLDMTYDDWSKITAKDLMDRDTATVEIDSSLYDILEYFAKTKFAIAPITDKGSLIGSIAIRDLLSLVSELNLDTPVKTIASPIVRIGRTESIKNSIELMLRKKIRNLVITERDEFHGYKNYILSDRKILEFIFSHEGRRILGCEIGAKALSSVSIKSLDITPLSPISEHQSISKTAAMLADLSNPALLLENYIVTPWDVVMKTIGQEN